MLVRVFYVSEIADEVSDLDVQVFLGAAQIRNRRLDITGLLVEGGHHFLQLLEGRVEAVDALMDRIARDRRHRAVRLLLREEIVTRQFSRWSMGLRRRDDVDAQLRRLHDDGCASAAEARRAIVALMLSEPRRANG